MSAFNVRMFIAVLMTLVGAILLLLAIWISPPGEIHNSVLLAFGETSTFVAAVLGIDTTYRSAWNNFKEKVRKEAQAENKSE